MEIKTIIVDWHGVCDHVTFENFVRLLAGEQVTTAKDVKLKLKDLAHLWTIGKIEPQVFWSELATLFSLSNESILKLQEYVLRIDPNESVLSELKKLKSEGYRIILLSDCPKDKRELIMNSSFAKIFKGMFFSCEAFMSKDNHDFFINILHDCNIESHECLYIDDNQKHIDTAEFLNFKTLLFSGNAADISLKIKNISSVPM